MRAPSAVLFDACGTLFDVDRVGALPERFFPGQGRALAVLWRDKQIEYAPLVTTSNEGAHYRPFSELTRTGLPAGEIAFVSSNGWDALAATWYGFRTLWINRHGLLPFETLGTQPKRIGSDLRSVLDFFPTP